MFIKELHLNVDYEKRGLAPPEKEPVFTGYILKNYDEYCKDRKRPAVIICPGGGYAYTSDREATPMATEFLAAGMSAFVLRYSCAPSRFPTALIELATAVKMVREHAEEWNIDPNRIIVQGGSAGGHLAASLGVFWDHDVLRSRGFQGKEHKPNALILAYPVISGTSHPHVDSFKNLLGDDLTDEMLEFLSLEKRVSKNTPPSFIWHTLEDECVPCQNSMAFADALLEHHIPLELHIFPEGSHSLVNGNEIANVPERIRPKVRAWIPMVMDWIKKLK